MDLRTRPYVWRVQVVGSTPGVYTVVNSPGGDAVSFWLLAQIVVNLVFLAGLVILWIRLKRPPQDDPRLSRGLQLLQTKITILEDLADRTDNQVKQLTNLIDQKTRLLQNKMLDAEQQIVRIDHSMNKSMEVAEIFQDKIPHEEIMERKQKVEYVRAARMAHSGMSVEDIASSVSLPREQVELIAKFNREQLMFDVDRLPEWANRAVEKDEGAGHFAFKQIDFLANLETGSPPREEAAPAEGSDVGTSEFSLTDPQPTESIAAADVVLGQATSALSFKATTQTLQDRFASAAEELVRVKRISPSAPGSPIRPNGPEVRKAIFPRINGRSP